MKETLIRTVGNLGRDGNRLGIGADLAMTIDGLSVPRIRISGKDIPHTIGALAFGATALPSNVADVFRWDQENNPPITDQTDQSHNYGVALQFPQNTPVANSSILGERTDFGPQIDQEDGIDYVFNSQGHRFKIFETQSSGNTPIGITELPDGTLKNEWQLSNGKIYIIITDRKGNLISENLGGITKNDSITPKNQEDTNKVTPPSNNTPTRTANANVLNNDEIGDDKNEKYILPARTSLFTKKGELAFVQPVDREVKKRGIIRLNRLGIPLIGKFGIGREYLEIEFPSGEVLYAPVESLTEQSRPTLPDIIEIKTSEDKQTTLPSPEEQEKSNQVIRVYNLRGFDAIGTPNAIGTRRNIGLAVALMNNPELTKEAFLPYADQITTGSIIIKAGNNFNFIDEFYNFLISNSYPSSVIGLPGATGGGACQIAQALKNGAEALGIEYIIDGLHEDQTYDFDPETDSIVSICTACNPPYRKYEQNLQIANDTEKDAVFSFTYDPKSGTLQTITEFINSQSNDKPLIQAPSTEPSFQEEEKNYYNQEFNYPNEADSQFDENGLPLSMPLHARALWPWAKKIAELKDEHDQLLFDIDPITLYAFAFNESALNLYGRSNAGATGLTQFMPTTQKEIISKLRNDPKLKKYLLVAQREGIDIDNIFNPNTAFFLEGVYMSGDAYPGIVGKGGSLLPKGPLPNPGTAEYETYMNSLLAAVGSYHDGPYRLQYYSDWTSIVYKDYYPIVRDCALSLQTKNPNPPVFRKLFRRMYGGLINRSSFNQHSTSYALQTMIGLTDTFGIKATEEAYGIKLTAEKPQDIINITDLTILLNALIKDFEKNKIFDFGEIDKEVLQPYVQRFVQNPRAK